MDLLKTNDLVIFDNSKTNIIQKETVFKFSAPKGFDSQQIYLEEFVNYQNLANYFKKNHPLQLLKGIKLLTLKYENYQAEIVEICEPINFVDNLVKKNTFKRVTNHLKKLGITQNLLDQIPINHAYYGMREICSCSSSICYHSNVVILKYHDYFVIPYLHSYASPYNFLDFDIRNLKPTKEYDLNEEDEDDWEKIFDNDMNYLGKKKPEFLSSHIAKQTDFKVSADQLFKLAV